MCNSDFGQDDSTLPPDFLTADSTPVAPDASGNPLPVPPSQPLVLMSSENPPAGTPQPDDQYSKYYTLKDLTVTSLPYPNLPLDADSQSNLRKLGTFLDAIRDNVGSFVIASAYRSPENQAALQHGAGGAAAASMAVSHSYHSMGLAADITPTNGMTPTQFAQAIYNDPICSALAGQIVDKSEGGNETSLHVSIQTPKFTAATPMYVVAGQYYRMTKTQIGDWLSSRMTDANAVVDQSQLVSDDEMNDYGTDWTPILLIGGAGLAALLLVLAKKGKLGKMGRKLGFA